jgi:hypothetical protein
MDCTIAMARPFATQRLCDLGADVVEVERIVGGAPKTRCDVNLAAIKSTFAVRAFPMPHAERFRFSQDRFRTNLGSRTAIPANADNLRGRKTTDFGGAVKEA